MKVGNRTISKPESELNQETLIDIQEQERAEKLNRELEIYDIENVNLVESEIVEATKPLLLAKVNNRYEVDFLASLCEESPAKESYIELCIDIPEGKKPIGFIELSFDNIQRVHEYNSKIEIGFYVNGKYERLTAEKEICLL